MALHWDLESIKDWETLCFLPEGESDVVSGSMARTTWRIITTCMTVRMRGVREDNHVEFWMRAAALDAFSGLPVYLTLADVKAHIGLEVGTGEEVGGDWWEGQVASARGDREAA